VASLCYNGPPGHTETRNFPDGQAATENRRAIEPCIPTLVQRPPSGPNGRHEAKWDGYRLHCYNGKVAAKDLRGENLSGFRLT